MSDVWKEYSYDSNTINHSTLGMETMMEEYIVYKAGTQRDPVPYLEGTHFSNLKITFLAGWEPENNLHMLTIFINSPTFDLIEKGAKTTFVDKLAAIGGTLGLFTGFSVISGIEASFNSIQQFLFSIFFVQLIYFLVNMVFGLVNSSLKNRKEIPGTKAQLAVANSV